jgi:transcription elongation GreA/GreB family factor
MYSSVLRDMDTAGKIAFKNTLKQFCQQSIEERINAVKEAMKNAQDAANSEEKSSAGDKYETGRAMGHLQKDMHARQLAGYLKEQAGLHAVNTGLVYDHATAGALVQTEKMSFFIAAGLGKQSIDRQSIYCISPYAPLASLLHYKKRGDRFSFNKEELIVTDVF